jgi:hypothetical protein
MHIRIKDYSEKLDKALSLASNAEDLISVRQFLSVVGFDFYFNCPKRVRKNKNRKY